MSTTKSISITVGVVLVAVAAILAGAAMFLVDQGEETSHLYQELRGKKSKNKSSGSQFPGQWIETAGNGVELRGHWLGMSVTNLDSPSAQRLGLVGLENGAAVVGVDPADGRRAMDAGIQTGDVLVGVDGKPVKNLADLYDLSGTLPADAPLLLDVARHGQVVTLVVPPAERDPGVQAGFGPQFYCPRDGILVPAQSVRGAATCPRCNGPLHLYHAGAQPADPWAMR